ncbi:MaoC family dehydratase [Acrocarpospora pleiomorpha]|uniref:MaoC family dehydratase n=1 Tax=Acrocarpospora pleiomorpha TaxID=90975 RepID=A0A5M3XAF5_9ACTN|nr:MaoC/PaaZ C-terminal domain-containing protein [Acrocarpospora pleiomorpha]GES17179.1 MaoC family dehydratase [Acrocarpospora pleiomorpha]
MTVLDAGAELPALTVDPISRTTLALFAGASGDHNPIHVDLDVARSAGLDDVFAHGMLSMAYLGRLVCSLAPPERIRSFGARFVSITPVHGRPTCSATVRQVDVVDGERRATVDLVAALADGTITLTGEAVIAVN